MTTELLRDAQRPGGRWLLVEGSEQSFLDLDDPTYLEFEYVELAAGVIDCVLPRARPIDALHLGGGLATIPRWVAATRPGSRQRVAETSPAVLDILARLPAAEGVEIDAVDASAMLVTVPERSVDLLVCDVYDGPETVTSVFGSESLGAMARALRPGGLLVANISDASPFALARAVCAGLAGCLAETLVVAEPPVLRGRRSGNVVLVAGHTTVPVDAIRRRASGGRVRGRVLAGDDLDDWIGAARAVVDAADLPRSGESAAATGWSFPGAAS